MLFILFDHSCVVFLLTTVDETLILCAVVLNVDGFEGLKTLEDVLHGRKITLMCVCIFLIILFCFIFTYFYMISYPYYVYPHNILLCVFNIIL